MARRHGELPGESGARVQRAVRPDRVRVLHVHVARTVVHAVVGRESEPLRVIAKLRHLVVQDAARIARLAGAGTDRRHAGAVQRVLGGSGGSCPPDGRHRRERNDSLRRHRLGADDRLEEDLRELLRELLLAKKVEQRRERVD